MKRLLIVSAIVVASCASTPRPVLYPNAQYKAVGGSWAEGQVDECIRLAGEYATYSLIIAKYRVFVKRCLAERGYEVVGW